MVHFPHLTEGKIGKLTYREVNEVFRLAEEVETMRGQLRALQSRVASMRALHDQFRWFDAMLIEVQADPQFTNRWRYSWREAIYDASDGWIENATSQLHSSGFTNYAINDCEQHNNGTGAEGMGVDPAEHPNVTLEMQPIMTPMKVEMFHRQVVTSQQIAPGAFAVKTLYSFARPNAWKVTCGSTPLQSVKKPCNCPGNK